MIHYLGTVRKKALYDRWYARFPPAAKTLDVSLREVQPPREKEGWYDYPTQTIWLVRGYGDTAFSFCHELGHHWSLHWPPGVYPAWEVFWKAHLLDMPSKYSRTAAAEGAAEAVAYYFVKPRELRPVVAAWLKEQGL